jgi:hypothetical protein
MPHTYVTCHMLHATSLRHMLPHAPHTPATPYYYATCHNLTATQAIATCQLPHAYMITCHMLMLHATRYMRHMPHMPHATCHISLRYMPYVTCATLHATCFMLHAMTCYMPHATCHMLHATCTPTPHQAIRHMLACHMLHHATCLHCHMLTFSPHATLPIRYMPHYAAATCHDANYIAYILLMLHTSANSVTCHMLHVLTLHADMPYYMLHVTYMPHAYVTCYLR